MTEETSKTEKILESYDLASFIEIAEADLASGRLSKDARFSWEIAIDTARESSPFTTVQVVENQQGQRYVKFVEPKIEK